MNYIDVIIPAAVPKLYTYALPSEFSNLVAIGQRVLVQFGQKKLYSCVVRNIHNNPPLGYEAKPVIEVIDSQPIINLKQLQLIEWISEYYLCSQGEVLNAALPTALKMSSETMAELNPNIDFDLDNIDEHERIIIEGLQSKEVLSFSEIEALLRKKSIHKYIKSLLSRDYIVLYEQISDKFVPKKITKLALHPDFENEDNLNTLFSALANNQKQTDILLFVVSQMYQSNTKQINKSLVSKNKSLSESSLKTLISKGVLVEKSIIESRFPEQNLPQKNIHLSDEQNAVFEGILSEFAKQKVVLLHGITASGKTEIYCKLAQECLNTGRHVLFLVPEISLSIQLVNRLKSYFGDKLGVYHSKYSDNERTEVWNGIESGRFEVVLGTRSSVFLPFSDLGVIIVDEEHDWSYKQSETNPRFNAKDTAVVLANLHQGNIIMGSATPSLESYYNAKNGKYALFELKERFGKSILPNIEILDLKKAISHNDTQGIFSNKLLNDIRQSIKNKEQVIIFQNRRGYSPFVHCNHCNWIPQCKNCDVSLTFHKYTNDLRCHYCGYKKSLVKQCESCGSSELSDQGYGTEKIEKELSAILPEARIGRMDLETTKTKNATEKILSDIHNQQIDILIGTQMVTKGMDFENVALVAVLNADNMLGFPDFRAEESTFQLLTQVSGRAGRRHKQGKVVIQTFSPNLPVLNFAIKNDYSSFYYHELHNRKSLFYPPFSRLINIKIKHRDKLTAQQFSLELVNSLRGIHEHNHVLGPATPAINRIKNLFIFEILLKFERSINNNQVKQHILKTTEQLKVLKPDYKNIMTTIDVDPK